MMESSIQNVIAFNESENLVDLVEIMYLYLTYSLRLIRVLSLVVGNRNVQKSSSIMKGYFRN